MIALNKLTLYIILLIAALIIIPVTGCMMSSSREVTTVKAPMEDHLQTGGVLATPLVEETSSPREQSSSKDNNIKLSLSQGFDGYTKPGDWAPVRVWLENTGEPVEGSVVVRPAFWNGAGVATYSQRIDLDRGSKKSLLFVVPAVDGDIPLEASFVKDKRTLVKTSFRHRNLNPGQNLLLALIDDSANRQFFKDIGADLPDTKIVYMNPNQLPFRDNSLSSVSAIVISGTSTSSFSRDQQSVLINWVASGGRLIIGGGPSWKQSISGIPETMRPVKPTGTSAKDSADVLKGFTGIDAGNTGNKAMSIPTAEVSSVQGTIIAGDRRNPLVVTRDIGAGKVVWTAVDVTLEPFTSWRNNAAVWKLFSAGQTGGKSDAVIMNPERFAAFGSMQEAVSSMPALNLPRMRWLAPYLLIYILLIGPVNYVLLKRRDRKELAWVTIPGIILLFAFGSFGYAYVKKGGDVIVNQIDVVEFYPGTAVSKITSTCGIFSPAKRAYDVVLPKYSSVAELSPMNQVGPGGARQQSLVIEDGISPKVTDVGIGMWAMRVFQSERHVASKPPLSGIVRFSQDGLDISLTNETALEMTDAAVVMGGRFWNVGTIPRQKDIDIHKDNAETAPVADNMSGEPFGHRIYQTQGARDNHQERQMKAATINSIFGFQGELSRKTPVLVAWLGTEAEKVKVVGERPRLVGKTVYIVPLQVVSGTEVYLPLGALERNTIDSRGLVAWTRSGFMVGNGFGVIEYTLPLLDKPYSVDSLKFHVAFNGIALNPGGQGLMPSDYTVSVYEWRSGAWRNLDATKSPITIETPGNFINNEGKIRARLSTDIEQIDVGTFDFEVVGKWR